MRILVLDDREETVEDIYERLIDVGYIPFRCYDIYEADEVWENNPIDVIITDLSFAPAGLSSEEKKDTCGSSLTGWVWLINHICKKENFDILNRTIILSEYISLAEKNVHDKNIYNEYFQSVKKISKSGNVDYINSLDEILVILKQWESGECDV